MESVSFDSVLSDDSERFYSSMLNNTVQSALWGYGVESFNFTLKRYPDDKFSVSLAYVQDDFEQPSKTIDYDVINLIQEELVRLGIAELVDDINVNLLKYHKGEYKFFTGELE